MLVCYAVPPQSLVHGGGEKTSRALALLPAPSNNPNNSPAPKAFGAPRHCVSPSVGKEAPPLLHHFCTISAPFPVQIVVSALSYEPLTARLAESKPTASDPSPSQPPQRGAGAPPASGPGVPPGDS